MSTGHRELAAATARARAATEQAEQLTRDRDALIVAALADGLTHVDIARATGLTRGRVGQIATAMQERARADSQRRAVTTAGHRAMRTP